MLLEICVDSFESAKAAIEGGADRLELCSALGEGGLTPSLGLLEAIKSQLPPIEIFAMLRPHNRISYIHSDTDMEIILSDMKTFAEHGIDGYVFGALKPDRGIDVFRCEQVLVNAKSLPVTFHRAFDMTIPSRKLANLELINNLGFKRILTSGFAETAEKGIDTLRDCLNFVSEQKLDVVIMPGCGITPINAEKVLQETGCREFHGSAKIKIFEKIPSNDSDTRAIAHAIKGHFSNFTDKATVEQLVQIKGNILVAKSLWAKKSEIISL